MDRLFHQAEAADIRLTPGMAEGLARGNPRMIAYVADLIAVRGKRPAIETRHDGGPLEPGKTYTVNENGPEAVVDWDGKVKSMGDGRPALVQPQKPGVVLASPKPAAPGSADLQSASGILASIARPAATSTPAKSAPWSIAKPSPASSRGAEDIVSRLNSSTIPGMVPGTGPLAPQPFVGPPSPGMPRSPASAQHAPAAAAPAPPAAGAPASVPASSPPGYSKGVLDLAGQMKEPLHRWSEYFNRKRYNPDWPSSYEPVLANPNILFTPVAEENDGDWQQHIVDNAQNVLVHYPSINGVIGASMESGMNTKLPQSIPFVGGKTPWQVAGRVVNGHNGQGKPFQWDAGIGDFNMGTLDKLWAANSGDFEKAGFTKSGATDRPAQLQAWAATPNGTAFVTALLFDKFREEYVPHMRGASESELAQAFNLYYRAGEEKFRKLYEAKIGKTIGQKTDKEEAGTILNHPSAYPFTPETRPQGQIDNWDAKHQQLKGVFDH